MKVFGDQLFLTSEISQFSPVHCENSSQFGIFHTYSRAVFSPQSSFDYHFNSLRDKAMKSLHFVKYMAHLHNGLYSRDPLRIINGSVRGAFDYGCLLQSAACSTERSSSDIVYNSAARFNVGLPHLYPLPILYRVLTEEWIARKAFKCMCPSNHFKMHFLYVTSKSIPKITINYI